MQTATQLQTTYIFTILVMVSPAIIRFSMGILGNIFSILLFLSPLPTFCEICKKGSIERYSAIPYLVTFLNCSMWLLYSLPVVRTHSVLLLTVSVAGCMIELVYLVIYVVYSNDKKKRLKVISILVGEIVFVGLVAYLVLTMVHTAKSRVRVVGIIGVISAVMMYASPLSVMKLVMRTKSVEYMPFYLSLASFINASVWTTYGFLPFDPYIVTPSGLGILLGLAQLILYGLYFRSTKKDINGPSPC